MCDSQQFTKYPSYSVWIWGIFKNISWNIIGLIEQCMTLNNVLWQKWSYLKLFHLPCSFLIGKKIKNKNIYIHIHIPQCVTHGVYDMPMWICNIFFLKSSPSQHPNFINVRCWCLPFSKWTLLRRGINS